MTEDELRNRIRRNSFPAADWEGQVAAGYVHCIPVTFAELIATEYAATPQAAAAAEIEELRFQLRKQESQAELFKNLFCDLLGEISAKNTLSIEWSEL